MSGRRVGRLVAELRRRHVFRVAMVYAAVAFVVVQVADIAFPALGIPEWATAMVILVAALGLPIALVFAWAYDLAPDWIKRSEPLPTSGDWQQIEDVLHAALELPSSEQPAFVARVCSGNPALRGEVQSLLAAHARPGVLDRPVAELGVPPVRAGPESFPSVGRIVGRYEILEKLGGGGMGVVYKARDLRLERIVALKFLPPHLSADARAKERFVVEAQAAAALDHPNICTIHEIGEADDGHLFLAMPFYDGETLKHRLAQGPLPSDQAIAIAIQVAQGLSRAHDGGIVHRDIKPANLVITGEGVVKIVDFGVAKLADVSLTSPGVTPGTVAYMSPEQARSDPLDGRTDLWSLGVVMYEMLTGERPFRGVQDGVLLNNIQTTEPRPISTLRPGVPPALEQVVTRALAKAVEDRYPTARDLIRALEAVDAPAADPLPSPIHAEAADRSSSLNSGENTTGGILPEGERRQATIVASTVSGYMALVECLVPEEVGRLVGRIREEAIEVAARHGGTLNRFAGDEMVLLFGIPTTHEDDGIRAVRSALELHARVRALSEVIEEGSGPSIRLQTGIDTGRVIVQAEPSQNGDRAYRIAGRAAQIAVRLASHAEADEVWTSPECQHLIGPFFEIEAREALAVRDRNQPLIPYCVLTESGLQTRLEAAEKVGLTAYTGREVELTTLQRCLDDALQGEGQFATVTGEAGMGKSRLLHEFRHRLEGEDVSFMFGRCQSDGGGVPYLPFIEILRSGLRFGEPGPRGVLESTLARIREIGPELEEFIPLYLHLLSIPSTEFRLENHLQGDTLRLAMQEALAAILTLSARRQPTVVLLEDWHWADEASHTVLKQVAEVVSGYPLLVVVTTRPGYGVDWGNPSQHTPVQLRALDASSLVAILRSFLQVKSFPDELAELLYERTGGNPFFLEEICMALLEAGAIRIEGGEAHLTGSVQLLDLPDSIQAVIRTRIDFLDRNARDVLRLAAVVGREFTRSILERAVVDGDQLSSALEALRGAGLVQQTQVVPEATYRFKHVLTQEVAYASLLEHQRRDLHGRVGSLIEQLGQDRVEDHLDRLAHHFSRAEEWQKAVQYGVRSAERAGGLAQYWEALQILERTQRWLTMLPEGAERLDALVGIMLRQERLCETLGLRERQQLIIDELVRLLEPAGDQATLAEVYLRQGDLYILLRRFEDGEEVLQRSLGIRRELADTVGEQKALRSLGLLRWHEGRNQEALALLAQVISMDRERNDIVALVGDLTSHASVLRTMGEYPQARVRAEEALALTEEAIAAGSPVAGDLLIKQTYILPVLAYAYWEAGDLDGALEHVERASKVAKAKRLPVILSYLNTITAHICLRQGRIEESLSRYQDAVEFNRKAKFAPGLSQTLRIRGEVLLGLNRYDEAALCLEEAASLFAQLEDGETEALMWTEIAGAHSGQENHAGAVTAWSKARGLKKRLGDRAGELEALEGLGAAVRRTDAEPSLALSCYREAAEIARSLGEAAAEGRVRNILGILEWGRGAYDQALPQYEQALTIFRDLDDTAKVGLMLNSVGVALKAVGRLAEARNRLDEAVAVHRQTGEVQLEGHALAALGDISIEVGDPETARKHYQLSLELRRRIGDRRGEGWMLLNLGRIAGTPGQADELTGDALRIAEECGYNELAGACEQLRAASGD